MNSIRAMLSGLKWRLKRLGTSGMIAEFTRPIRRPDLVRLHADLHSLYEAERRENPVTYNSRGKIYQSYRAIELISSSRFEPYTFPNGRVMTVEDRLKRYGLEGLAKGARVLDIGANTCFVSIELARRGAVVDAVERNPALVEIGRRVARHLDVHSVSLHAASFIEYPLRGPYDVILCLSAFHTHDRHETSEAETFFSKIEDLLAPKGLFVFLTTAYGCGESDGDRASNAAVEWIRGRMEILREERDPIHEPMDMCHKTLILARRRA